MRESGRSLSSKRRCYTRIRFFAGKAAPAYQLAKVIIKFVNNLAQVVDNDPTVRGKLKVVFLPEYNVTLAERCIPAADVSNQISAAGYEASGTSNMKFMMNGALTLGTRRNDRDGGGGRGREFLPVWPHRRGSRRQPPLVQSILALPERARDPESARLDLFRPFQPGRAGHFRAAPRALLTHGDAYMHLADLTSYLKADTALCDLYRKPDEWARKSTLNIAGSGKFSSDRTIQQYADEIWGATPRPVA